MVTDYDLIARTNALEKRLANVRRELPGAEVTALAAAQSRADAVMAPLGGRASPPMPGETSIEYRRRLVGHLAVHSPRFKDTRFGGMDSNVLGELERHVYNDAETAARDPSNHPPGILIPIKEQWADGRTVTRFAGDAAAFLAPFTSAGYSGTINPKLTGG
jgi:hypothetical protein